MENLRDAAGRRVLEQATARIEAIPTEQFGPNPTVDDGDGLSGSGSSGDAGIGTQSHGGNDGQGDYEGGIWVRSEDWVDINLGITEGWIDWTTSGGEVLSLFDPGLPPEGIGFYVGFFAWLAALAGIIGTAAVRTPRVGTGRLQWSPPAASSHCSSSLPPSKRPRRCSCRSLSRALHWYRPRPSISRNWSRTRSSPASR